MTNTDDGFVWKQFITDAVPPGAEGNGLKVFMQTVDLQGVSRTTSSAYLESEPIKHAAAGEEGINWWKAHVSWLADDGVESIVLTKPFRSGTLSLPNELTDGSFPPWLTGQGFSFEMETVQVTAKVTFKDQTVREELLSVEVNATDAETREYTNVDSFTNPEPIPVGLAQELYNAVNRREFKSDKFSIVEQECSGLLVAGYTFNVTDGREEWKTMKALVNETVEDIATGTTRVIFGPPPYLNLDDAIEILRQNRTRSTFTFSTISRATGKAGIDSRIDMPSTTTKRNSGSGTKGHQRLVVKTSVSDKIGSIDVNAAATIVDGVERPMAPIVLPYCQSNPDGSTTTRKILVLASQVFD